MILIPVSFVLSLLAAAALGVLRPILPRLLSDAIAIAAAAATSALLLILTVAAFRHGTMVYWFGHWTPHHGIALGIDFVVSPFSAAIASLAAVLTTASFCFAWKYFEALGTLFPTLMLVFLAAMIGYCFSGDLFTLFVFFELMSTVAYALTGYKIGGDALEGALTFAVVNSLAALLFLWGIALLYGNFGALNLAQLGEALQHAGPPTALTSIALALLATGFLTKAVAVPFHFWHAEADSVAPIPVCVLISGILAPLGLYGLGRVYWSVFAGSFPQSGGIWTFLLGLGGVTALVGAIMATKQRQLKRLLAFSTISHVGMVLCGLATALAIGVGGALVYLIGNALVEAALFLAVGIVLHRLKSVDRPELHGRGRGQGMTWTAILFIAGALGLAGSPPFATFTGKALMEAAAHDHAPWVPYLFTLTSGLTGGVVLRVAASIFLGWGPAADTDESAPTNDEAPETKSSHKTPLTMLLTPTILLILAACLGVAPWLGHAAQAAATHFLDAGGYRALILHAKPLAHLTALTGTPYPGIDAASLIGAATALAIALIFATISLFGHYTAKPLRKLGSLALRPLASLERLHNGDIRDYVTWLVLGATMLAGAFTVILTKG